MKNNIIAMVKSRQLFFVCFLLLLLAAGISIPLFGNNYYPAHPFWLNVFFINYTFMGDGIFAIVIGLLCIFYFNRKNDGMSILASFLFTQLLIQLAKNLFAGTQPGIFFEAGQTFLNKEIAGSSPALISGHTAMAFAIATVLILHSKKVLWQMALLAAAVLLGYSRIYLAQHSLSDVLIGSVLGTLSGLVAVYIVYAKTNSFAKLRNIFKVRYKDPLPASTIQTV